MEILNNIWGALSTENEGLMRIILIPFTFLEVYIGLLLFSTFLKISCTRIEKIVYVCCFSITSIISMNLIPAPVNTLLNYIILFILINKLFRLNILKTILAIILPFGAYSIIGIIELNPFMKIFNINAYILNNVPLYRIPYLCILHLFVCIIIFIFKLKDTKISLLDSLNKKSKNIIILNLLLGLLTLVVQIIINAFYLNVLPIYITLLSAFSLLFYLTISLYSLNHFIILKKTTLDLENAENYNKTLSFLYDNVKGFKHDFDDIVNMIGGYVRTNDLEGLKKYYLELENDYEKVKNIATLNPTLINNPGIYNLLVSKYKKATEFGVKVHLEYFFDFDKINMPIYQFSRMFGILLDNAIEAAKNCDEKEVNISFRDSSSNKTQIIIVENTYSNKDVDTSKIFEKGVSEKKDHMGMGLWEVNQIIMKNNNIHLVTTKDDKYFKQQLEIYY